MTDLSVAVGIVVVDSGSWGTECGIFADSLPEDVLKIDIESVIINTSEAAVRLALA